MPLPETPEKSQQVHQSLAFFVNPDDNYVVESLDGSAKYDPITAGDYTSKELFAANYWLNRNVY